MHEQFEKERKLVERHNEASHLSVFTMRENLNSLMKGEDHFDVDGNESELSSVRKSAETRLKMLSSIDTGAMLLQTSKTLKSMLFTVNRIVEGEIKHVVIPRTDRHPFVVEVTEGTFTYYRIEVRGLSPPLKLTFEYQKEGNKKLNDLVIYMSRRNRQPDAKSFERKYSRVNCITIDSIEATFSIDYFYFKFESDMGCKAYCRLLFPTEEKKEKRKLEQARCEDEAFAVSNKKQMKFEL